MCLSSLASSKAQLTMNLLAWTMRRRSMSPPAQESHGQSRPHRPRANTSFAVPNLPWRRNRPDSTPLSSSPAAPVQTLPMEALLQSLAPPAVPSLTHARSLVTALSTQTPAPPATTLTPILFSLCTPESPPALQAVGFDALTAYCNCGTVLSTSDRLTYFELVRTPRPWSYEVWECRLKALNALMPSVDDTVGVEGSLLATLRTWLGSAADELFATSPVTIPDRVERERAVEVLGDALTSWSVKVDNTGRLGEAHVSYLFDFYQKLVERALRAPPLDFMQNNSTPPTPFRENSSPSTSSPKAHRRHPSSASNLISPSSISSPQQRTASIRQPSHLIMIIYLNFLESRITRLPVTYLDALVPVLSQILATYMSQLSAVSLPVAPRPPTSDQQAIELRVLKIANALLTGPYSIACLTHLKRSLLPTEGAEADPEVRVKISTGSVRMLRLQIRQVLEDRLAANTISSDSFDSATYAGTPGLVSIDQHLLDRAQRGWQKERNMPWDAKKIGTLLNKAIRAWIAFPSPVPFVPGRESNGKETVLEEVASVLKDVLEEMERQGENHTYISYNETMRAVGETLLELVSYIKSLRYVEVRFVQAKG